MNLKRFKDITTGVIVGALVVGATPAAFAQAAKMNIPVSFNNIKVVVDGNELKTDKEPFIYDGTTYLPVRAVAEAVGKEVAWDGATQTVTLGTATTKIEQPVKVEVKPTIETVEFKEGEYIVGKDIAAGTYTLTGDGVVGGYFLEKYGFAVILTDNKDFHYPQMDTYYVLESIILKDGQEVTIGEDSEVKFEPQK